METHKLRDSIGSLRYNPLNQQSQLHIFRVLLASTEPLEILAAFGAP